MWRDSGLTVHKEIYLEEKQHVKSLIEAAKKDHVLTKFKECAGDQTKSYKVAEQILHCKGPAALPNMMICKIWLMISVNSLEL